MADKSSLYSKSIIRELYFANLLSCADISNRVQKSLPLVTKTLNRLIQEGYVLETGYAPSTGGRRPLMYSLQPDVMYILAVAMDQFFTRIVLMDIRNTSVTEVEKFALPLSGNPSALVMLAEKIEQVIDRSGISKQKIAGIGIGMPGFIDTKKGVNYSFFETGNDFSICEFIRHKTGLPVYLDNDSRLIALAELRFGAAREKHNAMVVNIGWGIGLGLILNGVLFKGHDGFAGELSHIPLFMNGKLCSCGKTGCLETETSLSIVVQKAREGIQNGKNTLLKDLLQEENLEQDCTAVMKAAGRGDRFAIELLSEAGYNIGRGVAILIHLMNPETIVLSGRGSIAGKIWQAPIQQALNEHCIPRLAANTDIMISDLGYDAELVGAAALVMENYGRAVKNTVAPEEQVYS